MSLHIGCCGWAQPQAEYFRNFSTIEVQQTFYQPPRLETLVKWRQSAPPEFEFTLKLGSSSPMSQRAPPTGD